MTRFSAALVALCIVFGLAASANAADGNYMLGTTLVLKTSQQLVPPSQGWWADSLPLEYSYGQIDLVRAVNASRQSRGVSSMIDVKTYPIAVGGETQVDGGWEYTIDFNRMTPDDVQAVTAAFPFSGKLSDAEVSYRPMNYGYFYGHGDNGQPATLSWEGETLNVNWGDSTDSVYSKLEAMLKRLAGPDVTFDLSMSQFMPATGVRTIDVNVSVYLNGATGPNPVTYEGEGGL